MVNPSHFPVKFHTLMAHEAEGTVLNLTLCTNTQVNFYRSVFEHVYLKKCTILPVFVTKSKWCMGVVEIPPITDLCIPRFACLYCKEYVLTNH